MQMTTNHCYLSALEVTPMQRGEIYDTLPLRCTLMHRFWSELNPDQISDIVRDLCSRTLQIQLNAHERLLLGPKQVAVSELQLTDDLKKLHNELYKLLNSIGVEYTGQSG